VKNVCLAPEQNVVAAGPISESKQLKIFTNNEAQKQQTWPPG
jgi:hypothetical protein